MAVTIWKYQPISKDLVQCFGLCSHQIKSSVPTCDPGAGEVSYQNCGAEKATLLIIGATKLQLLSVHDTVDRIILSCFLIGGEAVIDPDRFQPGMMVFGGSNELPLL